MTTPEAIQILLPLVPEEAILIATTGYISRDVCAIKDRPQNFYMIGSMGLAPAIGLGIALANPERKVVVFDGDGSLLMGLGILPMVGSLKPKNFIHLVFDNECYQSTGSQRTYSQEVSLEKIAQSSRYQEVKKIITLSQLQALPKTFFSSNTGPSLLLIKCLSTYSAQSPRIPHLPEEITQSLRQVLADSSHF